MRTRMLIAAALAIVLISATRTTPPPLITKLNLRQAAKEKLITVTTTGKGGYTGNVLLVEVKNISGKPLSLELEAGIKFHPDDKGQQDILVTGQQQFALAPGKSTQLDVNGMCCISHNASPSKGMNFTMGELADTGLVRIAKYIDSKKLYESDDAQDAVWVISDGHRAESIDFTQPENEGLVEEVMDIKDIPRPQYVIDYAKDPIVPFTGNAASVKGNFRCKVTKQTEMTMALYDAAGKVLHENKLMGPPMPGDYTFGFEFNVYNFPKGVYYARVIMQNKKMAEVKMEI